MKTTFLKHLEKKTAGPRAEGVIFVMNKTQENKLTEKCLIVYSITRLSMTRNQD
jgi:hypothetical protein